MEGLFTPLELSIIKVCICNFKTELTEALAKTEVRAAITRYSKEETDENFFTLLAVESQLDTILSKINLVTSEDEGNGSD